MKTKNLTQRTLLELALAKPANEDGLAPAISRESNSSRKLAWSPSEVWRTRVKASLQTTRPDQA